MYALMVCYDIEFSTFTRILFRGGVEGGGLAKNDQEFHFLDLRIVELFERSLNDTQLYTLI